MPPRYDANSTVAGKAVVGPGDRRGGKRQALGAQGQHPAIGGGVVVAADGKAALRAEQAPRFHAAAKEIGAADEARDEGVGRRSYRSRCEPTCCTPPFGHDDEPVGHRQRLLLVVRDHHRGQPQLLLQLADLDAHFLPQLGVEIGQRLVEQQDVGLDHERAGERHALLLPARQFARQALRETLEPDEAQRLREPAGDLRRRAPCAS